MASLGRIEFSFAGQSKSRKTNIYSARCNGDTLGYIAWRGAWRKYVFFPEPDMLFDASCLREIADFCEAETKSHKEKKNA